MKTSDFQSLPQFRNASGRALIPVNDEAENLLINSANGEIVTLKDATQRDIRFHRAYFGLLSFIYDNLTPNFKSACKKGQFYQFLKELQGEFEIIKIGKLEIKNYKSISFGRMSQNTFKDYVKNQLPFIYENVIRPLYSSDEQMANIIIDLIEQEWEKFLNKL